MVNYSVVIIKDNLLSLIDKVFVGEEVVIMCYGKLIVELCVVVGNVNLVLCGWDYY